jgi:formyltetrahydrofolate-dependent phosphoribosylglycinamide formyltransferase
MNQKFETAVSLEEAAEYRNAIEAQGGKLVFTSGCFDLLHAGHVRYLRQARAEGSRLLVAMNSDDSVKKLKGPDRPLNSAEDRAEVLLGLEAVDAVVIFDSERTTSLIDTIKPHIFAKGGDYTPESIHPEEKGAIDRVGAKICILPEVAGKSTSATLRKMHAPSKTRLAVMGSGAGTNFEALQAAIQRGEVPAEVALVLSDKLDAPILAKATNLGLSSLHVPPGEHPARISPAAEKEMGDRITASGAEWIVLAGFMRILSADFVKRFAKRIINVHPSLLPDFPGKDAIPQALAAGVSEAGCTVHYVDAGVDTGEIIAQTVVPVEVGETEPTLRRKIQLAEHALLPKIVTQLISSKI